jgi:hypothetical protein
MGVREINAADRRAISDYRAVLHRTSLGGISIF